MTKKYLQNRKYRRQGGFTLLEILVVVAILLLLVSIVGVNYIRSADDAKKDATKMQLANVQKALDLYKLDNGFYPTTDQGLKALVEKPDSDPAPKRWKQYMVTLPTDSWKGEIQYMSPGSDGRAYDLFSYGPDQTESEDDISVVAPGSTSSPDEESTPETDSTN